MSTRRWLSLPLTLIVTACSQRAPWRVVSAPVAAPQQQAEAIAPAPVMAAPPDATAVAHMGSLLFPVPEVDSTRLDDSFDAPRDGGARKHNAIDIMAPRGAAVLAVQDGRILRLSKNVKGGNTVYATDLDEQFVYYYAHLDRYHANIYAGRPLMRGDTIGYVGTTGNAPKELPHLHFQVMHMPADHKFWSGDPVNPYPLLSRTASRHSEK
jgi:peptidoglycan LD-endopeptidase LytH